jgi:Flp pilus assembly protein TadG
MTARNLEGSVKTSPARRLLKLLRAQKAEEGGSLVEMALVSAFVYLPMLFVIFEVSYAVYAYNFVANVAHGASRYAAVRGSFSCAIASSFPDCNLGPGTGSNPASTSGSTSLQNYVRGMAYPGITASDITVNATWWEAAPVNPGNGSFSTTTWPTQCTANTSIYNCNQVGNAVRVTVTYPFSFNIPFLKSASVNLSSTSQMIISE